MVDEAAVAATEPAPAAQLPAVLVPGAPPAGESVAAVTPVKSSADADASTAEEKPRRKRSRWGPSDEPAAPAPVVAADAAKGPDQPADEGKKKRRSRWAEADNQQALAVALPAQAVDMNIVKARLSMQLSSFATTSTDPECIELAAKLNDINRKLMSNNIELPPEEERSPSPEPVYDGNGMRQNTRQARMFEKLQKQRSKLITQLVRKDPQFRPPADWKPEKHYRKLYIPVKDFPGYNFFGLIVGPRGNTQKRMQRETNCRITIRGKGSVKEGSKDTRKKIDIPMTMMRCTYL